MDYTHEVDLPFMRKLKVSMRYLSDLKNVIYIRDSLKLYSEVGRADLNQDRVSIRKCYLFRSAES